MTTREKLYKIFFETETKAGRYFDVLLLRLIVFSVLVVMLESVPSLGIPYHNIFFSIEWVLTIVFTIEYIIRIWASPQPLKYIFSIWGIIDLLSILPLYLSLLFVGYHYLVIIRIFRLLRVFRLLKIARFNAESQVLVKALRASSFKIGVFLWSVMALVVVMGTLMYVIEGGERGFTSIPQSIYWAIVTITTVGYGDLVPETVLGKFISSVIMITGYAIIAVPTGIITVEMSKSSLVKLTCTNCGQENDQLANFCNNCGDEMASEASHKKE